MTKGIWLLIPCVFSGSIYGEEKKVEPVMSEEFLLFLADMEELDGELVHAIDLTQDTKQNLDNKMNKDNLKQPKKLNDKEDK